MSAQLITNAILVQHVATQLVVSVAPVMMDSLVTERHVTVNIHLIISGPLFLMFLLHQAKLLDQSR